MIAARPTGPSGRGGGAEDTAGRRPPLPLLLPLVSGVLLAASAPPAPSPLVPFVALVPLALFVAGLPPGEPGRRTAATGGLVAGLLQHAWGLRWLPGTLGAVAAPAVGAVAFAGVVLVLAALTAAAAAALHRLVVRPRPIPLGVALAVTWTALEWALAHLPFGLAFPWAPLGLGLTRWPGSLGVAELVGVSGVTLWLGAVNGLCAAAALRGRAGRVRAATTTAAAACALALLPVVWGGWRVDHLDAPVVGRVAALSLPGRATAVSDAPAGSPSAASDAWDPVAVAPTRAPLPRAAETVAQTEAPLTRAADAVARTQAALAGVEPGTLDLVVLPEMAFPVDPGSPAAAVLVGRLRRASETLGAPLLLGALGVDAGGEYNSAVLLDGAAGGEGAVYRADKHHLVPGVERASAVHAAWLAPRAAGYARGTGAPVARLRRLRVGALLCYDVAFAAEARALVRAGAQTLAALTSDAWFGTGGARDAGIAQQQAHLALRSIETRTGAVRSSSGGPALVVDPTGRVSAVALAGAAAARVGDPVVQGSVRAARRATLFVRTGDLAGPSAALALGALVLLD